MDRGRATRWRVGVAALVLVGALTCGGRPAEAQDGAPPECQNAVALAAAGQAEAALELLLGILATNAQSACTAPVVAALAASPPTCAAAKAVLDAGFPQEAVTAYRTLLEKTPTLQCAIDELPDARAEQVALLCEQAAALDDADQDDTAKETYRSALTAAGQDEELRDCAEAGLDDLEDEAASVPSQLEEAVRVGTLALWWAGAATAAAVLVIVLGGWLLRFLGWFTRQWYLTPRVQVAEFKGGDGVPGSAGSLTPMLRARMTQLQDVDDLHIDVANKDARFDNVVTAVKDVDAKLAAWATLSRATARLVWPWRHVVVAGHLHSTSRLGAGLGVWVAEGLRDSAEDELWERPFGSASDAALSASADSYLGLAPGAAAWYLFETTRQVSRTRRRRGQQHSPPDAGRTCHAYLVAGHELMRQGMVGPAVTMYEAATRISPDNRAARTAHALALVRPDLAFEERAKLLRAVLALFHAGEPAVLRSEIWGLAGADA